MRDLGKFDGLDTVASAINDIGWLVGYRGHGGGFLWTEEEGFLDLSQLLVPQSEDWFIRFANDINIHGQIAAMGVDSTGREHALLLTPVSAVPEPSTWAFLFLGVLATLARQRTGQ